MRPACDHSGRPNLHDVLACVVRGRVVYLTLSGEQKRALRDRDARIALDVVRHLLAARAASVEHMPPDKLPVSMFAFQAVARKLGHEIGQKRSYRLIRRLVETEVLLPSGSYRQAYRRLVPSGFRVTLWRIGVCCASLFQQAYCRQARARQGRVGKRWWQHELFGDASGRPPPGLRQRDAARMLSLDEREVPWAYGLA